MNNFSYHKKYHYLIKYIVIGLPILCLLGAIISYSAVYESVLNGLYQLCSDFRNLSINSFYNTFLRVLGMDTLNNELSYILISFPLYIIWVYLFDIIVDIFTLIPKLCHKFINKLGGGNHYE